MTPLGGEQLFTLGALSRLVPGRGESKSISPRTLSRWILRGARTVKGERVYLAAVRSPSGWLSSVEALWRFFAALGATARSDSSNTPQRTPASRTRASEAAESELKKLNV